MTTKPLVGLLAASLLGLVGCGLRPPTPAGVTAVAATRGADLGQASVTRVGNGTDTVAVRLSTPAAASLALQAVHRWMPADIYEYDVTLTVQNDQGGWDPVTAPVKCLQAGPEGETQTEALFQGLSQGKLYRAHIQAFGNAGGTAPDQQLDDDTCYVNYDFTAPQDVEDTLSEPATITFKAVPFSGTATTNIERPADGTFLNPTQAAGQALPATEE